MELVPIKTVHGEGKAWETLAGLSPEEVCDSAGVSYDWEAKTYRVRAFGTDFLVSLKDRTISSTTADGEHLFLGRLKDFFRLSVLWYLTSAKHIPFTEKLAKPVDIKGGQRFSAGTHVLPTEKIAERFGTDKKGFIQQGRAFGGEVVSYGDAAVRLYALPRVPVTVILWLEDEEFPPRVDILFDSTCNFQLSLSDIVWAVAMMSAMVMLVE
jgi:hypothetical protein